MEFIYWLSVGIIIHSYILYPLILRLMARNKEDNKDIYTPGSDLPEVSILMSVYNEELVMKKKLFGIINTNYPSNRLEIIIGSDNSTDLTNNIITDFQAQYPGLIKFIPSPLRQGKPNTINQLVDMAKGEVLIITDANVMFDHETIYELVKHFKNEQIGIVDSHMINSGINKSGISIQENAYISREVMMKRRESLIWGTMMGPFGGCYAIRKELFCYIPKNFLVDDFFINMKVLEQGKKSINNLNAKVYEDVSNNLSDEFRRKVRIATGNFQNLAEFAHILLPFTSGVSFSFLSHKVLRWYGPFFLILALISNLYLIHNKFYFLLFSLYSITFVVPFIDFLFKKIGVNIIPLRFITHFYSMNIALLIGFVKYIKGVKSNVWQPTKRYQST